MNRLESIGRALNLFPAPGSDGSPNGVAELELEQSKAYIANLEELAAALFLTYTAHTKLSDTDESFYILTGINLDSSVPAVPARGALARTRQALDDMFAWHDRILPDNKNRAEANAFILEIQEHGRERLSALAEKQKMNLPFELNFFGIAKDLLEKGKESDNGCILSQEELEAAIFVCQGTQEGRDKIEQFYSKDLLGR